MKPLAPRRNGALIPLLALLVGCGGSHGGGSSASPADKVAAAFKGGNFAGTFDPVDDFRSRGTTPTASSIQFDANGGVVSFASGTSGTTSFRTFSANITNIVYANQTSTNSGASGTINFDLVNFTANDFITGTAHFSANYTVAASNFQLLTTAGKLTGKSPTGAAVSLGYNLNYQPLIAKVDLTGNYTGTIDLPGLTGNTSQPWTGSLTAVDDLHLKASIVTSSGTIAFTGQNTHSTLASAFDGAQINALATGAFAQFYVQTNDNGATLTGAYFLVDSTGAPFLNPLTQLPVYGTISAKKATSGGGTTTAVLKAGYYDGGIKNASGALDGRILKLNITKVSATAGANGGMVIVTGDSRFNIGGRVASVTASGSTATVTIDNISNTYKTMVLTGPVSGTSFAATYTATKLDGTTETGSLDQFGQGSTTTTSLTGSWTGTAVGGSGGSNPFAATFKSNGDGTVLVTPTSTIGGGTNPTATLPAFTAYQAGSSFAGHASGTVNVTSLGTTIPVSVVGDFDGDVGSNRISGDYIYNVTLPGSTTSLLADSGTLSLTKS